MDLVLRNYEAIHTMDLDKIIKNMSKSMRCTRCTRCEELKRNLHPETFMCSVCERLVEKTKHSIREHNIAELTNVIKEMAIHMKKMQNRIDKLKKKSNVRPRHLIPT
jgi:hypothetical protein